jgi:hypothetical protein
MPREVERLVVRVRERREPRCDRVVTARLNLDVVRRVAVREVDALSREQAFEVLARAAVAAKKAVRMEAMRKKKDHPE